MLLVARRQYFDETDTTVNRLTPNAPASLPSEGRTSPGSKLSKIRSSSRSLTELRTEVRATGSIPASGSSLMRDLSVMQATKFPLLVA